MLLNAWILDHDIWQMSQLVEAAQVLTKMSDESYSYIHLYTMYLNGMIC